MNFGERSLECTHFLSRSLQGTLIRSLPVSGLDELVNLNLENVYNLWELHASQLSNIRHLLLTYEFLCCSFVDNMFEDTWEVGRQEQGVLQECKHATGIATDLPSNFSPRLARNPRTTANPKILSSSMGTSGRSYPSSSTMLPKSYNSPSSLPITSHKFYSGLPATLRPIFAKELARSVPQMNKNVTSPSLATSSPKRRNLTNQTEFSSAGANRKSPTKMSLKFPTKSSRTFWRTTRLAQSGFVSPSYNGSLLVFTLDPCDLGTLPTGNIEVSQLRKKRVICRPKPDEFNPCEDILGSLILRISTWIVSVCATTGNLVTLIVILLNRRKINNHKLLMCTLAFSSLCMGVYLIILVAVDTETKGCYNKYAKRWQHGVGCKFAGFMSIFSTELSVFTLNIITLERYYTIIFPLHQSKWMTVKQTAISLVLSLLAALVLATLPLTGISSYTTVAICLPFDVSSPISKAYVTFLLASNGASFFAVLFAYIKMYFNIQHTARATFADLNIAKKMAVIVLTNFACWAPIAIFSLTAIYGEPIVDVPTSKFLLVFVFPINALTNPFLYFLITKRFKQDLLIVFDRCHFCPCCAGSNYLRRERTSSFPTTLTRTTHRSRSRRNSGNSLISMFCRPPSRSSVDNQSSTPRHSVPRGSDDRRGSVLQRTVTFLLPAALNVRRRSEGSVAISPQTARRKSYDMVAKCNNILPGTLKNIDDNTTPKFLVSKYRDGKQTCSDKGCGTPFVSETAC